MKSRVSKDTTRVFIMSELSENPMTSMKILMYSRIGGPMKSLGYRNHEEAQENLKRSKNPQKSP
jgi:hypothetical protein